MLSLVQDSSPLYEQKMLKKCKYINAIQAITHCFFRKPFCVQYITVGIEYIRLIHY